MNLNGLNLVHLHLTVHTGSPGRLVKRLPLFGSRFTDICRDLVCRRPAVSCDSCSLAAACAWHAVFSQKLATDPSELKRHQKPPLPFAFTFPDTSSAAADPGIISFSLVVAGAAVHHLDLLLTGFSQFLGENSAILTGVFSLDYQGKAAVLSDGRGITSPENLAVISADGLVEGRVCPDAGLKVVLHTPLRIIENGRLRQEFNFGVFARSVMRRISSLAYYYGEHSIDADFAFLAHQANAVTCSNSSFLCMHDTTGRRSGITGHGTFTGDFSGLLPFLVLGEFFHAGKGASYGLGNYTLHPA